LKSPKKKDPIGMEGKRFCTYIMEEEGGIWEMPGLEGKTTTKEGREKEKEDYRTKQ